MRHQDNPTMNHEGRPPMSKGMPRWYRITTVIAYVILAFAVLFGTYIAGQYHARANSVPLDHWRSDLAEQYSLETINDTNWGEIIHQYEGWSCEAHRWRYRGVYYIGQVGFDCGDLIIEPTKR